MDLYLRFTPFRFYGGVLLTFKKHFMEKEIYATQIKKQAEDLISKIGRAAANPEWSDKQTKDWKKLKEGAKKDIEKGINKAVKAATL